MGTSSRFLEPIEVLLVVEDIIEAYETGLYHIGVKNESGENIYPADIEYLDRSNLLITMSDGTQFEVMIKEV